MSRHDLLVVLGSQRKTEIGGFWVVGSASTRTAVAYVASQPEAELFAAAPDLLEALKLAQKWLANCVPVTELDGPAPLPIIAAALAKAEGQ